MTISGLSKDTTHREERQAHKCFPHGLVGPAGSTSQGEAPHRSLGKQGRPRDRGPPVSEERDTNLGRRKSPHGQAAGALLAASSWQPREITMNNPLIPFALCIAMVVLPLLFAAFAA